MLEVSLLCRTRAFFKRWQFWVGLVVSLFFLFWALRQVSSLVEVGEALKRANYVYVLPALALYFLGVWFRTLRWHFLLSPVKRIPASRLFPVVVIGYMANDVLPARMGEVVRAYVLGEKETVSKTSSLATIAVERIFDGVVLLLFAVAVASLVPFGEGLQNIVRVGGGVFAGGLLIVVLLARWPRLTEALVRAVLTAVPSGIRPRLAQASSSFVDGLQVMQHIDLVLRVVFLSALAWLAEAGMYYLIGMGFDLGQPFHVLVLTTVVANLGTMVPSSPGYVGTFEALSVFTLGLFGVGGDVAMSYTIVLHVALLVPGTLLGFGYLWQHHLSLATTSGSRAP